MVNLQPHYGAGMNKQLYRGPVSGQTKEEEHADTEGET